MAAYNDRFQSSPTDFNFEFCADLCSCIEQGEADTAAVLLLGDFGRFSTIAEFPKGDNGSAGNASQPDFSLVNRIPLAHDTTVLKVEGKDPFRKCRRFLGISGTQFFQIPVLL